MLYEYLGYAHEHDIDHFMDWDDIKRGFSLFAEKLFENEYKLPAMQELPSFDAPAFKGTALTAVARLALWLQQLVVMGGAAHPVGITPDGRKTPLSVLVAQLINDVYIHFPQALEDDVLWPRHFTQDSAPLQEVLIESGLLPDPGTLDRSMRHKLLQSFSKERWVDLAIHRRRFNIIKFIGCTKAGWAATAPRLLSEDGSFALFMAAFQSDVATHSNEEAASSFPYRPTEVVDSLAARHLMRRLSAQKFRCDDAQVGYSWFWNEDDSRVSSIARAVECMLGQEASHCTADDFIELLCCLESVLGYPQGPWVAEPKEMREVRFEQEVGSALCRYLLDGGFSPNWSDIDEFGLPGNLYTTDAHSRGYHLCIRTEFQTAVLHALQDFLVARDVRQDDIALPRYVTRDGKNLGPLKYSTVFSLVGNFFLLFRMAHRSPRSDRAESSGVEQRAVRPSRPSDSNSKVVTDWLSPEVAEALAETQLYEDLGYCDEVDLYHFMGWEQIALGFQKFEANLAARGVFLAPLSAPPSPNAIACDGAAQTAVARLALWVQQLGAMGGAAHPHGIMDDGSKTPLSVLAAQLLNDVHLHFPRALQEDVHWPGLLSDRTSTLQYWLIWSGLLPDPATLNRALRHEFHRSFAKQSLVDLAIRRSHFNFLKFIACTSAGWEIVAPRLLAEGNFFWLRLAAENDDWPHEPNDALSSSLPHRPTEVVDVLAARNLLLRLRRRGLLPMTTQAVRLQGGSADD